MEKNRIRSVKTGKSMRMSYQRQEEVLEMPNLIEVQRDSYKWFLDEGLREVFDDISPIADYSGKLSLEFIDFTFDEKDAKYTIEQCKERDATYAAPLKVRVRLINKETEEINEHEIFMGDLPIMTVTGTFVINGAERVIVSQLVRSPGIYYAIAHDKLGKRLFSSTVIPNRGAWLEYETDSNDVFYVRVDRTRKVPITVLIRALGVGSNAEIIDLFGEEPKILASFTKDTSTNYQEGLLELYKKIRPGEPLAVESAESLINAMFFDPRRYDLAKVGRYKFNKKLHLNRRIVGHRLAEDVVDASTGEILAEEGTVVTKEMANTIQNSAVPYVWILGEEDRRIKVLSNLMVDIRHYLPEIEDPKSIGVTEAVYYPVLENILEENDTLEDRIAAIHRDIHDLIPKHITKEDIFASINYNMHLEYGLGNADDIDHLGNRRIRAVGELLQNQYRIGLSRLERVVRERMTTQDTENISPQSLINIKPVTAAVKEFFGSSQLSQFMDQNNPLGELTHKRRLSALGPGGLSRDRAGFEVRDVHYSHYGRMCPVETPEGPNIGLINSLASYARINQYGFIEAPYRKIDKSDPKNPRVTDEVVYMTADEEDNYHVAQANEPLDEEGYFIHKNVSGRFREETQEYERHMFDYMDVSPRMVFSVATALIPFLQNDDANRALMGSNMQRQAVPLLTTEAPVVGTGMEVKTAVDSGVCVVAKKSGTVLRSTSTDISIKNDDGTKEIKPVYIDGYRVYSDTTYNEQYSQDDEANPTFTEMRNSVLAALDVDTTKGTYANQIAQGIASQVYDKTTGTGAVIVNNNKEVAGTAQDLLNNGPKNEIYLNPNQAVVFQFASGITTAQIGLKALQGNAAQYTISYEDGTSEDKTLNSSTDMFYKLDAKKGTITITNKAGSGVLAITKIKTFGEISSNAMFAELSADDFMPALLSLGYETEKPMADATANLNLVDYTGKTIASTSLTANGEQGTDATFTADQIKSAVTSALPEGYAVVDASKIADQTVKYGESADVNVQIGKVATLKVTYKKLFGKTVGTATLTGVQTSAGSKYSFSASEIKKAVPSGYWTIKLWGTKVKYGTTGTLTVNVF